MQVTSLQFRNYSQAPIEGTKEIHKPSVMISEILTSDCVTFAPTLGSRVLMCPLMLMKSAPFASWYVLPLWFCYKEGLAPDGKVSVSGRMSFTESRKETFGRCTFSHHGSALSGEAAILYTT